MIIFCVKLTERYKCLVLDVVEKTKFEDIGSTDVVKLAMKEVADVVVMLPLVV